MSEKPEIVVKLIWSPSLKQEGFEGSAYALSSENDLGKFDILPMHANFVSLIFNNLTIHTNDEKEIKYKFKRGVLEVSDNRVQVFLGV